MKQVFPFFFAPFKQDLSVKNKPKKEETNG